MRPLLILAADNECAATLRGFFERKDFHKSLGCAAIQLAGVTFDSERDIRVHPGHDCGVWKISNGSFSGAQQLRQGLNHPR